jgi:hypothetical protein
MVVRPLRVQPSERIIPHRARLRAAHPIDRAAVRNHQKPPQHGPAAGIEPGRLTPHFQIDILGDLSRLRRIANHPQHQAVHPRRSQVIQPGKRLLIATRGASQQPRKLPTVPRPGPPPLT